MGGFTHEFILQRIPGECVERVCSRAERVHSHRGRPALRAGSREGERSEYGVSAVPMTAWPRGWACVLPMHVNTFHNTFLYECVQTCHIPGKPWAGNTFHSGS